jgi:1,4-dihydroxy-2-naphthoyl-CoA hydrolase
MPQNKQILLDNRPQGEARAIWKTSMSVEEITAGNKDTAASHLGIEFLEVGDDFLRGRVPVDARTRQPFGMLHGGVSVMLAETLGSVAAQICCGEGLLAVGLDINANHLRGVMQGWVTGIARPVHIGRKTHVWQIDLTNDEGQMTCVSRITMAIVEAK